MKNKTYLFSTSSHPDTVNISSLKITFFQPSINFSQYDYFIITSKQVSNFLKQYDSTLYKETKALCVSKKSAQAYRELGGKILEVGSGYGDNLATIIQKYPKESRWLYLRAQRVASNFAQDCKDDGYNIDEIVAYKSSCSDEILQSTIESNATLIFTSPSSVKCFLKTHTIEKSHSIIVIGKTTAHTLPHGINYQMSQETTVESCVKLLK